MCECQDCTNVYKDSQFSNAMMTNFLLTFALFFSLLVQCSVSLNQDGTFLLSFKYSVLADPLNVLENWNYDDVSPCSWTGVTCSPTESFRVIGLVLPNSQLLGSLPEELGLIEHLRTLDLSNNLLNGTLPVSLFNSSEIQVLNLAGNVISGGLPKFIPGMRNIRILNLSDNALAGDFLGNLNSLKNLNIVSLRSNYLSGSVPSGLQYVQVLDLSSNMFNGSLSDSFNGENLKYLNLSYNKISGSLSSEFAEKIPMNSTVDLSFNNLTGPIPESVVLLNQKPESFSGNTNLCGKPLKKLCIIPSTFSIPPNDTANGTSSADAAIAAIPKPIDSTPGRDSPGTESTIGLKPGTIAGIAVGDLAGLGVVAMVILYVYQLKKKNRNTIAKAIADIEEFTVSHSQPSTKTSPYIYGGGSSDVSKTTKISKDERFVRSWSSCMSAGETSDSASSDSDENNGKNCIVEVINEERQKPSILVMVDGETELEIETLLKASAYVLGSSSASIVYKAVLENGTCFAVRRIGIIDVREKMKDFESKVKAIDKLRHPNLVRIRGFHWGDAEKLVIYDYVSNGNLAAAGGYKRIPCSPCRLSFETRLKIARGVARGLTYIHEKKQVHGSIKPANILLTQDMEPVISDFGLDWLLIRKQNNNKTDGVGPSANMVTGCTSFYHAPESLNHHKPSSKWDVYSFGVILLELLTGKIVSDTDQLNLSDTDKNHVLRMVDVAIRGDVEVREDAVLACFKLGFSCVSLTPQKRPSMRDALQVLDKISCS